MMRLASDGHEHSISDAIEFIGQELNLTDADLKETLSSGQTRLYNRTGWAKSHLVKAELLEVPRRGFIKITNDGRAALKSSPSMLDSEWLKSNCPNYVENWKPGDADFDNKQDMATESGDQTPEEIIEIASDQLQRSLATELLVQVKEMSPQFFERLVVELLVKMGYGGTLKDAGHAVGQSHDGGIDGIIKEDRLGLDTIYIQAKRYTDGAVGRPEIQAFVGALQGVNASKGVFLTTSRFAETARNYVQTVSTRAYPLHL